VCCQRVHLNQIETCIINENSLKFANKQSTRGGSQDLLNMLQCSILYPLSLRLFYVYLNDLTPVRRNRYPHEDDYQSENYISPGKKAECDVFSRQERTASFAFDGNRIESARKLVNEIELEINSVAVCDSGFMCHFTEHTFRGPRSMPSKPRSDKVDLKWHRAFIAFDVRVARYMLFLRSP